MVRFKQACIMFPSARPAARTSMRINNTKVRNCGCACCVPGVHRRPKHARGSQVHMTSFESFSRYLQYPPLMCIAYLELCKQEIRDYSGSSPRPAPQRQTTSRTLLCHERLYSSLLCTHTYSSGHTHAITYCPMLVCFHSMALLARDLHVKKKSGR